MIFYKTLALKPKNSMVEYLNLIRDGDWRKVRLQEEPKSLILLNYDYQITDNIRKHELSIPDGVYKFKSDNDGRYFYGTIHDSTIVDMLFDEEQVQDVQNLIKIEKSKLDYLYNKVSFVSTNLDYGRFDERPTYNEVREMVYDNIEWDSFLEYGEEIYGKEQEETEMEY